MNNGSFIWKRRDLQLWIFRPNVGDVSKWIVANKLLFILKPTLRLLTQREEELPVCDLLPKPPGVLFVWYRWTAWSYWWLLVLVTGAVGLEVGPGLDPG